MGDALSDVLDSTAPTIQLEGAWDGVDGLDGCIGSILCSSECAASYEKAQDWGFKGREVKVGWYENGTEKK